MSNEQANEAAKTSPTFGFSARTTLRGVINHLVSQGAFSDKICDLFGDIDRPRPGNPVERCNVCIVICKEFILIL